MHKFPQIACNSLNRARKREIDLHNFFLGSSFSLLFSSSTNYISSISLVNCLFLWFVRCHRRRRRRRCWLCFGYSIKNAFSKIKIGGLAIDMKTYLKNEINNNMRVSSKQEATTKYYCRCVCKQIINIHETELLRIRQISVFGYNFFSLSPSLHRCSDITVSVSLVHLLLSTFQSVTCVCMSVCIVYDDMNDAVVFIRIYHSSTVNLSRALRACMRACAFMCDRSIEWNSIKTSKAFKFAHSHSINGLLICTRHSY